MKRTWLSRTMQNVPLSVADTVFVWANIVLVIGAILAFVGTAAVFWSTGIRERYADERIAANEAETAKANAEAAKANAEAAKAKLEQERLKAQMAWRRVSPEQAKCLIQHLLGEKLEAWVTFVGDDPEATVFREDINEALNAAGVKTKFFSGYARAIGLVVKGGQPAQRAKLVQAFTAAGLATTNSSEPGFAKNELEILVGSKSPPAFH
jgi:hypothetical protein